MKMQLTGRLLVIKEMKGRAYTYLPPGKYWLAEDEEADLLWIFSADGEPSYSTERPFDFIDRLFNSLGEMTVVEVDLHPIDRQKEEQSEKETRELLDRGMERPSLTTIEIKSKPKPKHNYLDD